jgi:hypothetical protein
MISAPLLIKFSQAISLLPQLCEIRGPREARLCILYVGSSGRVLSFIIFLCARRVGLDYSYASCFCFGEMHARGRFVGVT